MLAWSPARGSVKFGAPKSHSKFTVDPVMREAGAVRLAMNAPEAFVETDWETAPLAHLIPTVLFANSEPDERRTCPSTTAKPSRAGVVAPPQACARISDTVANEFRISGLRTRGSSAARNKPFADHANLRRRLYVLNGR